MLKNSIGIFLLVIVFFTSAKAQNKDEKILLWTSRTLPGGVGPSGVENVTGNGSVTNVSIPRLLVHRPKNPNGMAVLLIGGGGYVHIQVGHETTPVGNWLQANGVTAFELVYRLPLEGWESTEVPFQDAQRAMRLIRSKAESYGIDTNKIGVLGFSSGAHLAGMIAAAPKLSFYQPVDRIDSLSSRPAFAALIYPVITMLPPYNQTHSRKTIIMSVEDETFYSVELRVNKDMPPTFLAQSEDDPTVSVMNSRIMYAALQKAGIPAELHIFKSGGHGWGMGRNNSEVHQWTGLFENWAKQNGFWK